MDLQSLAGIITFCIGFILLLADHRQKKEHARKFGMGLMQFVANMFFFYSVFRLYNICLDALGKGRITNAFFLESALLDFLLPVAIAAVVLIVGHNSAYAVHTAMFRKSVA